jgi:CPA2 family monovalent cation:H+ antiporter-2
LGFSIALGAFLMGAIMAESAEAHQVVERIAPIREMFTAVFFVATGMLLDPKLLVDLWGAVLFITIITVLGKIAACSFGTFIGGYPGKVAVPVGLGMAQIGEFSFIIANLGRSTAVTSGALYPIAVAVSSLTTFLTPYLLRSAHAVTELLGRFSPRPLVTFTTFYTAWLSRLTERASGSRTVQKLFLRLILYLAAAVAIFVLAWSAARALSDRLPEILPRQNELLPWGIAALAALPFLFLIGRTLEALTQNISASLPGRSQSGAAGESGLVRNSLRFLLGWVAALFVLAAGTPVLPPLVPLAIVVVGLLATTFFFWESLVRFHNRVEGLLTTLSGPAPAEDAGTPAPQWRGRQEMTELLSDRYGPEVQTEDFVVPVHPTAVNQTIRTLGLRTATGASIIGIYRDPEQVLVPQLDTVILPGDVLLLLGEKEQLASALRYFSGLSKQKLSATASPPQAATVVIEEGSPFAGRTLDEMGFREALGVLIVGIRRGKEQITNPAPGLRVQAGDVLYLWGPPEQLEEARRRARAQ